MMRTKSILAVLFAMACCIPAARAEALKGYRLTIDGVAGDIDVGGSAEIILPDGRKVRASLERNEFATYAGERFSFVHPSAMAVTKTKLSDGIVQHLLATAVGTIVVVQDYATLNPVSLDQLMLQEMTKESVQAGGRLTQRKTGRRLADGKELTGISATVKTRTESVDYEILGYGKVDQGVIVITRIDKENAATDQALLDRFWRSLELSF
jgi:hypothetical protein